MIDALTVRALGAELSGTIVGGRVQNVYFVAPQTIGFEVYANRGRHYVLGSIEPQMARFLLVSEKLRSASVPLTPFLLLLKKYVNGAFVNRVKVVSRERILQVEFDHREQGVSTLVVELIGNRANLLLLDAGGIILDAMRRVPAAENRARTIQPRASYAPPPPQAKADPLGISIPELNTLLAKANGETLAERIVATTAGSSPLLARELAFRVSGATNTAFAPTQTPRLYEELTRIWRTPADPALALEDEQPIEVAAYALTHLSNSVAVPSMSAALERFYGAQESYEAVKAPLRAQLVTALEKLQRVKASLQRELVPADEVENLKLKGDMILGYQYTLVPGQTQLHADVTEELAVDVVLDPELSPVENAEKYFDEYRRARDARERVPERIQAVEHEISFAEQIINDLDTAESRVEIDQVLDEARTAELIRESSMRSGGHVTRSEPRDFVSPDGFHVLVGRNARQNDALTFEGAKPDDVWLHARGYAGSHVVIVSGGGMVPPSTLEFAATLAAFYSQGRTDTGVDVIYTPKRNVRRVSGAAARPGLVTVREERVLRVRPVSPE